MKNMQKLGVLAAAAALACGAAPAGAETELTLYAWGMNVSGDATLGQQTRSFDADFDDLVDSLEFGLMGHIETRGDRWGGGLDVVFAELEDERNTIESTLDLWIVEGFGTYRVNENFDLIAGIRQSEIEVDVDIPGVPTASGKGNLTDGFVGGRLMAPLSDTWSLVLRGDVGAGESDLVLNGLAAVRWDFARAWVLSAGYRAINYDFEGDTERVDTDFDITFDGFLAGISYRF